MSMVQMVIDGKEKAVDSRGKCPECGANWADGAEYSRLIGIEIQGYYDGVAEWLCPDCEAKWSRFLNR